MDRSWLICAGSTWLLASLFSPMETLGSIRLPPWTHHVHGRENRVQTLLSGLYVGVLHKKMARWWRCTLSNVDTRQDGCRWLVQCQWIIFNTLPWHLPSTKLSYLHSQPSCILYATTVVFYIWLQAAISRVLQHASDICWYFVTSERSEEKKVSYLDFISQRLQLSVCRRF